MQEDVTRLIYLLSSDTENKTLLFPLICSCLGLVDYVSCLATDREELLQTDSRVCGSGSNTWP